MIESFVITLREGVEAALVVCLTLAYLRKIERPDLRKAVGWGVALAALLAVAGAVAVRLTGFETEGRVEGIVLLVSCAMVTWLVFWMWRHGKKMKQQTEARLEKLAAGSKLGIFLFAFLMVFREGVEMVLLLVAANVAPTERVLSGAGAAAGLGVAVVLGVAFYKGTFRVDVRKFFAVTSILLLLFAFQLLVAGLHEFAESGDLKSGPRYMRIVGPLVKHSVLFVIAVLVLPFALLLRRAVTAEAPAANPAEERKARARSRGERIAKAAFSLVGIGVIVTLGVAWAHESGGLVLTPPEALFEPAPEILIPVESVSDDKLHRFAIRAEGKLLRFLVIRKKIKDREEFGSAMDACVMCWDKGYAQKGDRLICLNCAAELSASSLGEGEGCNPIPVKHERRGNALVIPLDKLTAHAGWFTSGLVFEKTCDGCGRPFPLDKAGGQIGGKWCCLSADCEKKLRGK